MIENNHNNLIERRKEIKAQRITINKLAKLIYKNLKQLHKEKAYLRKLRPKKKTKDIKWKR